ncbi:MAG: hypothetical protein KDD43_16090, partial [Bdellovibrionales bacterium]|nr:hypothetical protein [Bdellovibrionales bacterium]
MTGQSFGLAVLLLALAAGAAPSPAQAKIIFSENNQTKAIQAGPSLPPVEESQGGYCQDPGMNQRFADALRQCEYQTKEALETCDSKGVNALIGVQKSIGKGSKDVSISGELTQQGRVMLTEKKKSCDRIARLCYATCAEVRSMAERGRCSVLGFEDILKSCESGEAYTRWIQLAGSVVSATTFESGNNEEIPNNEIKPQSTNLASGIRPASTHPAFEDPFAGEPLDEDPLQDSHEQETAIPPPVEIQAA